MPQVSFQAQIWDHGHSKLLMISGGMLEYHTTNTLMTKMVQR